MSAMIEATILSQPQAPARTEAQSSNINESESSIRLSAAEQFLIGIFSGGLSALGLSTIKWILCIVIVPSIVLELMEMFQLAFCKPDIRRMRHMKRLRLQQYGHGVISGSGVSHLVADCMFTPSIFTVLNFIMYVCLSICWTLYWTFPTFAEFQKTIANPPKQQQPKTLPFFSEPKSAPLLKKTRSTPKRSHSRANKKTIDVPMGADAYLFSTRPQKKVRIASVA